jgi:hypothetical protein
VDHPVTQRNLRELKDGMAGPADAPRPVAKELACGEVGPGGLPSPPRSRPRCARCCEAQGHDPRLKAPRGAAHGGYHPRPMTSPLINVPPTPDGIAAALDGLRPKLQSVRDCL